MTPQRTPIHANATASLARRSRQTGLAFLLALPVVGYCQIYANAGRDSGVVVLSNFRSAQTPVVIVAPVVLPSSPIAAQADAGRRTSGVTAGTPSPELRQLIDLVAKQTALSPDLLHAVVAVESGYDPKAVSRKGAIGLMQLLPTTAKRFGADDLFAERDNLVAGARYLKWLMALFGDDLELTLAAYNAGEQAVMRAGRKIPPYAETQAYVKRIVALLRPLPAGAPDALDRCLPEAMPTSCLDAASTRVQVAGAS
jgi:hypothetical protein